MEELIIKIFEKIKKGAVFDIYRDAYVVIKNGMVNEETRTVAIQYGEMLSEEIENEIRCSSSEEKVVQLFNLHRKLLLCLAPYRFESFLLYIEWDREPDKKFYPPRRKALKLVVEALQDLADDQLDLLAVSMPPGAGKTTLAIFYLTWMAGRTPNEPMLTGSHSNSFIRGVYDECLRIFDPVGDYLWKDVFPKIKISNTNAKDCRIDLDKQQRFETLEFTSIGSGNAGLYRAKNLLYCDDLVSGIEVALSKERLDKLWETYSTDLRQRKIGDHCKELHIATRWSVHDVIGRLQEKYGDSDRARFIVLPAMDENDESNFDYAYGLGFTTEFYREQRDIMDDISWKALYMNEPIEREGLLYHKDELRRYFELPKGTPDAILGVCDTKDRGSDFAVLIIDYVYGLDHYIVDMICDDGLPETVDARLVEILMRYKVQQCRFESNSAGGRIAEKIQKEIKERGGITHITTKFTTANKETKIIINSAFVKENFLFKDDSVVTPGTDYYRYLNMLTGYTVTGRNKHDDVPDATAMLVEYIESLKGREVKVFDRPF